MAHAEREGIKLSPALKEVLGFLNTPKAYLDSVNLVKYTHLKTQLLAINREHGTVYDIIPDSESDTAQRRDLKVALDKVSSAAKKLLDAPDGNGIISKEALRSKHIPAFEKALEAIEEQRQIFIASGAQDGQAASGHIFAKMFDGNTLKAAVRTQAQNVVAALQHLAADKSQKLR